MIRGGRVVGAFALAAAVAWFAAPTLFATHAGAATSESGLNGTWQCCGAGGAAEQVVVMNGGTGTADDPGSGVDHSPGGG